MSVGRTNAAMPAGGVSLHLKSPTLSITKKVATATYPIPAIEEMNLTINKYYNYEYVNDTAVVSYNFTVDGKLKETNTTGIFNFEPYLTDYRTYVIGCYLSASGANKSTVITQNYEYTPYRGKDFATDDWETIFASLQADEDVYSIGDEKIDICSVGGIDYNVTFKLIDTQIGRYHYTDTGDNNHAVIEIKEAWATNVPSSGDGDRYYASSHFKTFHDSQFTNLPLDLQEELNKIGGVTVYTGPGNAVATEFNLQEAPSCKLFPACAYEIYGSNYGYCTQYEGQPQFDWYRINNVTQTENYELCRKHKMGDLDKWYTSWLRSNYNLASSRYPHWSRITNSGIPGETTLNNSAPTNSYFAV